MALEKILLGDATSTAVTKVNNAITQANTSADDIEEIKETLNVLENRDPMSYRGTLGTGCTITALPSTGVLNGDTYKVITAGTYNQMYAGVGDLFIAKVDNSTVTWTLVPSGDDGDVFADENFTLEDEIIVSAAKGTKKVKGYGYKIQKNEDPDAFPGASANTIPTSGTVVSIVSRISRAFKLPLNETNFTRTGMICASVNRFPFYVPTAVYNNNGEKVCTNIKSSTLSGSEGKFLVHIDTSLWSSFNNGGYVLMVNATGNYAPGQDTNDVYFVKDF